MGNQLKTHKNFLFSLLAVAFLWLFWLVAYFIVRNDYVLPSVGETLAQMGGLFLSGKFWEAFFFTFLRTLCAFLSSLVLGVGLSIPACIFRPVRAFFAPIVSLLRTVPTMAVVLVLLLWTSPAFAPVVVCFLVLFPAVYSASLAALDEVEEGFGELARAYRVPKTKQAFQMYLPLAAPVLLRQAGGILSMGLKITVSGEVLAATYRSLGGLMQEAGAFVEMSRLLALTLAAVLLGFALEGLSALLTRFVVRWKA